MSLQTCPGLALATLLVFSGPAGTEAASIVAGTFSLSLTASQTPVIFPETIAPFDPTLGTLSQVQIDISGTETNLSVSFENLQSTPVSFGFGFPNEQTFSVPGFTSAPPIPPFPPPPPPTINFLSAFDGKADFQGTDSTTLVYNNVTFSETRKYSGTNLPSFFEVPGPIASTIGISQDFVVSVSPSGASLPVSRVNSFGTITETLTVTYNYAAAVPEPTSWSLLGLGSLLTLALARRPRRE